jgi:hypothetical protein
VATESNFHQSSSGVRTYRGRTFGEILPQIRSELGPDAVILSEREGLVGGIGGFFAQRFIEVDARPGEARPIAAQGEEPGADEPSVERGGRPVPAGRRFETAAFIDRLREASAALRDDDIVELRATREPATGFPRASTPPSPAPPYPVSGARSESRSEAEYHPEPERERERERETMTKIKRKQKRKAKEKGSSKSKGKSKSKSQVKPQTSAPQAPRPPVTPMPQAWAGWAAQPDAPTPAPAPAWAAQAEATAPPESQVADERAREGLRRFLPDVIVAALLLIVLGPRRHRSSRHAPCPVCGRRGDGSTGGPYGRYGAGRPRFLRPRYGDFPCQCR